MMGDLFCLDRRLSSGKMICGECDVFVYLKIPFVFRVKLKMSRLVCDFEFFFFHHTLRILDLVTFRQDLRVIHHSQAAKPLKNII